MTLLQVIVLSLIQGLTEFLPISSSAHLILGSRVFGWPDQGLVFDVATHLGTLLAVALYFHRDLARMTASCLRAPRDEADRQSRRMVLLLLLASIPAMLTGLLASDLVERHLRDMRVIAWSTIGFGLLLWWADARGARDRELQSMSWRGALFIGLAQALALIPGTSRSGITITAGRLLGFDAYSSARFSFLLAIPIIAAAGAFGARRVAEGTALIDWGEFGLAVGLSALAGWLCIAAFLALVQRVGLVPFVIYRLILGVTLLWFIA